MKKLVILLTLLPFIANSQICTRTAANQATTDANITTALPGCDCVTPAMVGSAIDSCLALSCSLAALVSGSTGLQGTLNAGNHATNLSGGVNDFNLRDFGSTANATYSPFSIDFGTGANFNIRINSGSGASQPSMQMYDFSTGNYGTLTTQPYSGIYTWTLPNEGNAGLDGTLVTHNTKDAITINAGGTTAARVGTSDIEIRDVAGSNGIAGFLYVGGAGGFMYLKDNASSNLASIKSGALTGVRSSLLPDEGNGSGVASTLMLHTSMNAFTCLGSRMNSIYDSVGFGIYQNAGTILHAGTSESGGIPYSYLGDKSSSYVNGYYIQPSASSKVHTYWLHDGASSTDTIALKSDIAAAVIPSGPNRSIQFNSSGFFGGISDFSYNTSLYQLGWSGTSYNLIDNTGSVTFPNNTLFKITDGGSNTHFKIDDVNKSYQVGNSRTNIVANDIAQTDTFRANNYVFTGLTGSTFGSAVTVDNNGIAGVAAFSKIAYSGISKAQTTATTLTTFSTVASEATYEVGGGFVINSVSADVLNFSISWTDENNTLRQQVFYPMGATSPSISAVGSFPLSSISIRTKASTSIVIQAVLTTGVGSINYDIYGTIKFISN